MRKKECVRVRLWSLRLSVEAELESPPSDFESAMLALLLGGEWQYKWAIRKRPCQVQIRMTRALHRMGESAHPRTKSPELDWMRLVKWEEVRMQSE
jgi:hypothetical protein